MNATELGKQLAIAASGKVAIPAIGIALLGLITGQGFDGKLTVAVVAVTIYLVVVGSAFALGFLLGTTVNGSAAEDPTGRGSSVAINNGASFGKRTRSLGGREAPNHSNADLLARPWPRFWAKVLDIQFYSLAVGIALLAISPEVAGVLMQEKYLLLTNMACLGIALAIDAYILSIFGTSLGRSIAGLRVAARDGRPSFEVALKRNMLLYLKGFWLGVPILMLFAFVSSKQKLKDQGITSWDRDTETLTYSRSSESQSALIPAIGVGLFVILFSFVQGSESSSNAQMKGQLPITVQANRAAVQHPLPIPSLPLAPVERAPSPQELRQRRFEQMVQAYSAENGGISLREMRAIAAIVDRGYDP